MKDSYRSFCYLKKLKLLISRKAFGEDSFHDLK
ncbi:MAG: hypothetical protein ACI815_001609 [Psychroserpens sp.]